jgi:hypothetical protein
LRRSEVSIIFTIAATRAPTLKRTIPVGLREIEIDHTDLELGVAVVAGVVGDDVGAAEDGGFDVVCCDEF